MFSTLISAKDLQNLLTGERREGVLVFDCRHRLDNPALGRQLYLEGHIPGTLFAHLDKDLSAPIGMTPSGHSGRHPLPEPDVWMRRLSEWGVAPSNQVVAYDDSGGAYAARLWWMLRAVGHKAAAVLDGGLQAWVAIGGKLEEGEVRPVPAPSPYPGEFRSEWVVGIEEVRKQVESVKGAGEYLLVDARAPERYMGEVEPLDPIAGHIPGALSLPYQGNLKPDGTFHSPSWLRERFEPILQKAKDKELVMYCGSGVTACHNLLALEVAGFPPGYLFPNSWSGWSNTPGLPVARGEE
jgi:thiosulfate/3-mercaptopyruvate sulfurtransferase